ncbi:glutamyl-tRNA reductase [Pseudenhygromyxa sp. WMMC2535]|uniref:glutamyl-tRNA reductase n=1 Tax=Pseudenhygromyxa sp. WMMC2535 TaxID=2712867 RepID=UPI00155249E3|nr:glutamyl-tRNA reductase [Pseudenhygromyxa sp. WMMC2535]NVB41293.1 glutamyl-tRNA reductase [Pseudenhygromyxa sp. WMMC2535]
MTSLLAVGLNHTTAPVDLREQLAVPREQIGESLTHLVDGAALSEAVLLSTCNRVEIYAVQSERPNPDHIIAALAELRGVRSDVIRNHCFVREREGAARHIFRVAASLESMVIGEPQILGQVKDAWQLARERQTVGPVLDRCLTMAFHGAKRVRSETEIARGGASVASVAVDLARSIFGDLQGSTVALLGAGEMARQAAVHLRAAGASEILVVNRSAERGTALAEAVEGRWLPWEDGLEQALLRADVVVASTGASEPVIVPRAMRRVMRRRRGAPIFFVDIAVPRDIDPRVGRLDSVYVYDVDDLQKILASNLEARCTHTEAAGELIEEEINAFLEWQRARSLTPVIRDLREHARSIMEREVDKTLGRLGELDDSQREAVRALGHAITQKILHRPLKALRESAIHSPAGGEALGGALRTLFALEEALEHEDQLMTEGDSQD